MAVKKRKERISTGQRVEYDCSGTGKGNRGER